MLLIAVSAILTSAIGGLAGTIADWVGLPGGAGVVALVGLLAGILFDTLIMVVAAPAADGCAPALAQRPVRAPSSAGAVIAVLKPSAGFLISHATGNPLLSAVAIPVGLLFWLNLMSRVVLLASSWPADDVDLATLSDEARRTALATAARPSSRHCQPPPTPPGLPYAAAPPVPRPLSGRRGLLRRPGPRTARVRVRRSTSSRAVDRLSVAAGRSSEPPERVSPEPYVADTAADLPSTRCTERTGWSSRCDDTV